MWRSQASFLLLAVYAFLLLLISFPVEGAVLPSGYKAFRFKSSQAISGDRTEFLKQPHRSERIPSKRVPAFNFRQITDSSAKSDDVQPTTASVSTQHAHLAQNVPNETTREGETTESLNLFDVSSAKPETTVPDTTASPATKPAEKSISTSSQLLSPTSSQFFSSAVLSTSNLIQTQYESTSTAQLNSSPASLAVQTQSTSKATPAGAVSSQPELLLGKTIDLRSYPAKEIIYSGTKLHVSGSALKVAHSQILIKLLLQRVSKSVPSLTLYRQELSTSKVLVQLCGDLKGSLYIFDKDPSSSAALLPVLANGGFEPRKEGCANEARVEIPYDLTDSSLFLLVTFDAPQKYIANSLPPLPGTVTLFKESNGPSQTPWNVDAIRESVKVSRDSPPVDSSAWRAFVLASAPLSKHEELTSSSLDGLVPSHMDPFCDPTGTAMISLILGKNLGMAMNPHIFSVPIGGCSTKNNATESIRLALKSVGERLAKISNMSSRDIIVLQDSLELQQGLKENSFEAELQLIETNRGIIILPASNCTNIKASDRKFVAVASFGIDQASGKPYIPTELGGCINAFDAFAPGIDVVSAGTFGLSSRQNYTDTSLAAAALTGAIINIASSGKNAGQIDTASLKVALRSLKSTPISSSKGGEAKLEAKVLGAKSGDRDNENFVGLLQGKPVNNIVAAPTKSEKRIISSMSNPTFYALTAGLGLVCVAAIVGIVMLVGRRESEGTEDESFSPEGDQEQPQEPPSDAVALFGAPSGESTDDAPEGAFHAVASPNEAAESWIGQFSDRDRSSASSPGEKKKGDGPDTASLEAVAAPKAKIEPLNMGLSQSESKHEIARKKNEAALERGGSQVGIGKRQVVKTRLLTLTKKSAPETPGAAKASWFATPKSSQAKTDSFLARGSSWAKDAGGSDAGEG